ncbi:hypothetical protein CH302_27630 [Rhodococcus sp. 15-2388-1-1a]|nr:hypothetical protein CH302_27630 [Rhodococcus sp. 15-2388-1-1a]
MGPNFLSSGSSSSSTSLSSSGSSSSSTSLSSSGSSSSSTSLSSSGSSLSICCCNGCTDHTTGWRSRVRSEANISSDRMVLRMSGFS